MEGYLEAVQTCTRKALDFIRNLCFSVSSTDPGMGTKERVTDTASSPQFIDGESRFTIASDGQRDYLALFITKEMIEKIQYDVNLMGIEFYESFDLRVSLEAVQDADLLPYEDALAQQAWEENRSVTVFSAQSEQTEITSEELHRREVHERYNELSWALCNAREDYHNYSNFHYTQEQWEQDVEDGNAEASKSECDRLILNDAMLATGRLVDIEAVFDDAEAEADRLGLLDEIVENDSCFYGWDNRSSPEAEATHAIEGLDRTRIEAWMDDLAEPAALGNVGEIPEVNEWDAEFVGISDSISVVDRENYAKAIRRWREFGEAQRELHGFDAPDDDGWDSNARQMTRRHSWNGN